MQVSSYGVGFTNNLSTPTKNLTKPAPFGEQVSMNDQTRQNQLGGLLVL